MWKESLRCTSYKIHRQGSLEWIWPPQGPHWLRDLGSIKEKEKNIMVYVKIIDIYISWSKNKTWHIIYMSTKDDFLHFVSNLTSLENLANNKHSINKQ